MEIRNHAWTRFEDSFLIAGGRGGVQSDGVSDLDTIYRCVYARVYPEFLLLESNLIPSIYRYKPGDDTWEELDTRLKNTKGSLSILMVGNLCE